MKLYELFEPKRRVLLESVSLTEVFTLKSMKDPSTKKYYTEVVDVTGDVGLFNKWLKKFPVKFGKVGGHFDCGSCNLTTLEGAPREVGGNFLCSKNELTSLEGAPREIHGGFDCSDNNLTSLEGVHKLVKKINGAILLGNNPIKSGGIGLVLIEGLTGIGSSLPAFKIISKYIGQGKKGVLLCQDELIEAGYEEFARL